MTRPLTLTQRRRLAAAERRVAEAQRRLAIAPRGLKQRRAVELLHARTAALAAGNGGGR